MTLPVAQLSSGSPFNVRAIFFRGCEWKMDDDFDPLRAGQPLLGHFAVAPKSYTAATLHIDAPEPREVRAYAFATTLDFTYRLGEADKTYDEAAVEKLKIVASMSATLVADYLLADRADQPDAAVLENWLRGPSLAHIWPYWREFCHSTMLRMNLPVTIIPLMVMGPKPERPAPEELASPPTRKPRKKAG